MIKIQNENCLYIFENDYLKLSIERVGGRLFTRYLQNKVTGYKWANKEDALQTVYIPGFDYSNASIDFSTQKAICEDGESYMIGNFTISNEDAKIYFSLSMFESLKTISANVRLQGKINCNELSYKQNIPDGVLTGKEAIINEFIPENACILTIGASDNHLNLTQVELFDATDDHNLVKTEKTFELYSPWSKKYQGNIFIVDAYLENEAVMLIKEGPSKIAQSGDSEFDFFFNKYKSLSVCGLGLSFKQPFEIEKDMPLYSATIVVGDKNSVIKSYHDYYKKGVSAVQKNPQILSNTWGDRNADACLNEKFMLKEIKVAKKLGVDVIQLDDGWQKGHTAGSFVKKGGAQIGEGMYDQQPDFWEVRETFPHGLTPVIDLAKSEGLEVGLWYSCDATADYKYHEKDVENVIKLYNKHGVSTFKIDGIRLKNKNCEKYVEKILSTIREKTDKNIKINMDITAGRRFGYLYKREYGNLFLENRFTKSRTYYPHRTLRNLWDLSKYIPTTRFQIECVNVKKNADKYEGDKLAPINYKQTYAFAVTMMANPLMWMEMQNLEKEDVKALSKLIAVYKTIRNDLSKAFIEPIGDRPDGTKFTGFNATLEDGSGYLLLFKELNEQNSYEYNIDLSGKKLTALYKSTRGISASVKGGKLKLNCSTPNEFILLKY